MPLPDAQIKRATKGKGERRKPRPPHPGPSEPPRQPPGEAAPRSGPGSPEGGGGRLRPRHKPADAAAHRKLRIWRRPAEELSPRSRRRLRIEQEASARLRAAAARAELQFHRGKTWDDSAQLPRCTAKQAEFLDQFCIAFTIISGSGLVKCDYVGASDPYVKVRFLGLDEPEGVAATPIQKRTLDPEWGKDSGRLPQGTDYFLLDRVPVGVRFEVWDFNFAGSHEWMGQAELIGVDLLRRTDPQDLVLELGDCGQQAGRDPPPAATAKAAEGKLGTIRVSWTWRGKDTLPDFRDPAGAGAAWLLAVAGAGAALAVGGLPSERASSGGTEAAATAPRSQEHSGSERCSESGGGAATPSEGGSCSTAESLSAAESPAESPEEAEAEGPVVAEAESLGMAEGAEQGPGSTVSGEGPAAAPAPGGEGPGSPPAGGAVHEGAAPRSPSDGGLSDEAGPLLAEAALPPPPPSVEWTGEEGVYPEAPICSAPTPEPADARAAAGLGTVSDVPLDGDRLLRDPLTGLPFVALADLPPSRRRAFRWLLEGDSGPRAFFFFSVVLKIGRLSIPQQRAAAVSHDALYLCRLTGEVSRCVPLSALRRVAVSRDRFVALHVDPACGQPDLLLRAGGQHAAAELARVLGALRAAPPRGPGAAAPGELPVERRTDASRGSIRTGLRLTRERGWALERSMLRPTVLRSDLVRAYLCRQVEAQRAARQPPRPAPERPTAPASGPVTPRPAPAPTPPQAAPAEPRARRAPPAPKQGKRGTARPPPRGGVDEPGGTSSPDPAPPPGGVHAPPPAPPPPERPPGAAAPPAEAPRSAHPAAAVWRAAPSAADVWRQPAPGLLPAPGPPPRREVAAGAAHPRGGGLTRARALVEDQAAQTAAMLTELLAGQQRAIEAVAGIIATRVQRCRVSPPPQPCSSPPPSPPRVQRPTEPAWSLVSREGSPGGGRLLGFEPSDAAPTPEPPRDRGLPTPGWQGPPPRPARRKNRPRGGAAAAPPRCASPPPGNPRFMCPGSCKRAVRRLRRPAPPDASELAKRLRSLAR